MSNNQTNNTNTTRTGRIAGLLLGGTTVLALAACGNAEEPNSIVSEGAEITNAVPVGYSQAAEQRVLEYIEQHTTAGPEGYLVGAGQKVAELSVSGVVPDPDGPEGYLRGAGQKVAELSVDGAGVSQEWRASRAGTAQRAVPAAGGASLEWKASRENQFVHSAPTVGSASWHGYYEILDSPDSPPTVGSPSWHRYYEVVGT